MRSADSSTLTICAEGYARAKAIDASALPPPSSRTRAPARGTESIPYRCAAALSWTGDAIGDAGTTADASGLTMAEAGSAGMGEFKTGSGKAQGRQIDSRRQAYQS